MLRYRSHVIRWAAAAFGSLLSGQAPAAIIQWSYAGTVSYGYDRAGIFGDGADLTGESFTVVERFDIARGAFRYADGDQSFQSGGSQNGAAGSASLTVTIGGVSRTIFDLEDFIYSGSATGSHLDYVKDGTGYEYAGFNVESPYLPANYTTAITLDAAQATFIGNYQFFSRIDPALDTYASFDVATLEVEPFQAVPLPGGMALFGTTLIVFAGGHHIRRRWRARAENPLR